MRYLPFFLIKKTTATNSILSATSCHPAHVINNIPLGELIRLKRNCSDSAEFNKIQTDTCERLSQLNYRQCSLRRARNIVSAIPRDQLITSCKRFVAKRTPTVGNQVSPSLFLDQHNRNRTWLSTSGFYKCGHNICKVCKYVNVTKVFMPTSYAIARPYSIKNNINCNSKNVLYLVICTHCKLWYVGCTSNSLKTRIRRHLSDSVNDNAFNISAVSRHLKFVHFGDLTHFSFTGIKKVVCNIRGGDLRKKLLFREAFWIFKLATRMPEGLNVRQDLLYNF